MEILTRAAKVLSVDKNEIKVEFFSNELPQVCKAKGCDICSSNLAPAQRFYPKSAFYADVAINDIVKIQSALINDGLAAALVFLTPVVLAAVFYSVSLALGVSSQSGIAVFSAACGAVAGFLSAALFDKEFRKRHPVKISKE